MQTYKLTTVLLFLALFSSCQNKEIEVLADQDFNKNWLFIKDSVPNV